MIRLLLCVAVVAFFVLCAAGMRWGWRNRRRRQSYLPAFPVPPADLAGEPLLPPTTGEYVSTTTADNWQDRIAVGGVGLRSPVAATLYDSGLLLDRGRATPLWIPAGSLLGARTGRAMAGKVLGVDGLLVVRWRLGEYELDTGIRADDIDDYGDWITAIQGLAHGATATTKGGDDR